MGVAITLPFDIPGRNINGLFIILTAVNALPLYLLSRKTAHYGFNRYVLVFLTAYLLLIVSMMLTDNHRQSSFELEKKLSLVIFPFAIFFTPRLSQKELRLLLAAFIWSCIATGAYCLSLAMWYWVDRGETTYLSYHELSGLVGMHAGYLSMYYCFSIAMVTYLYHDRFSTLKTIRKISIVLGTSFLTIMVVLLATRTQMAILFVGGIGLAIVLLNRRLGRPKALAVAAIVGGVVLGSVFLSPTNRERFKEMINYNDEYGIGKKWGERQMRELIWTCAFELIGESPIAGVGTGDGEDALQQCYHDHDYSSLLYFEDTRFNAHNQYLEIALESGIPGALLFILSLLAPANFAWRARNFAYVAFILIVAISFLTESMLERQHGVVFFALFNSLLFFNSRIDA